MNIEKYIVSIDTIIKESNHYYAHANGSKKETLQQHSELCLKYLTMIQKQKNLDDALQRMLDFLYPDLSVISRELLVEAFYNVITMHDLGKINPAFQKEKMNNKIATIDGLEILGTTHSLLSSYIYLEYYVKQVKKLPKHEKKLIKDILYINAYVISRHHSNMRDFNSDFLAEFQETNPKHQYVMTAIHSDSFKQIFTYDFHLSLIKSTRIEKLLDQLATLDTLQAITLYSYTRLLYSVLVASDYYATSEFYGGVEMQDTGIVDNAKDIIQAYESSPFVTKIRNMDIDNEKEDINVLRTKIFLETEKELMDHLDENIYYLEAPTGSGKSNTALNLSLKLIESHASINKIFYVYPFNTLVEQNLATLQETFGKYTDIMQQITVVNSTTPFPVNKTGDDKYKYALLDRQFLNYPMILTTHVSLFDTLFKNYRESCFGFYQIMNSVIVLDEIQSYRISRWNEIIAFLKQFAYLFNCKIIIMSATLPNLELLTDDKRNAKFLIKDRNYYFSNPIFKDRVKLNYDLLQEKDSNVALLNHVLNSITLRKKILIEFITRKSAEEFYRTLRSMSLDCEVLYTCGQDSIIERQKIIHKVKHSEQIVLVATQVIEAGIDIDMDIGYKDISKLDSEEQFMGRINRSCRGDGIVYFFNLDNASMIYKQDNRASIKRLTLENKEMQETLSNKNFGSYYQDVLTLLKKDGEKINDQNVEQFFKEVGKLYFGKISERMELIQDKRNRVTIFLGRVVSNNEGNEYDGRVIWQNYKSLLEDYKMEYSEKMYRLSQVKSIMNYFMYEIIECTFDFDEQIGNIFYIEDGEKYIVDDKLDMKYFDNSHELFI